MNAAAFFVFVLALWGTATAQGNQETPAYGVMNVLERCSSSSENPTNCLENAAANALERALKTDNIVLAEGVSFQKSSDESALLNGREGRQVDMNLSPSDKIWNSVEKFIATRSINFNLGEIVGEGRGKKKKYAAYYGIALATAAAILIPLKLKLIALMAATALMTGKIALVIASLVGLKKLVSKPSEETTHVHYDSHRSDPNSHFLAYGGQAPVEYPA